MIKFLYRPLILAIISGVLLGIGSRFAFTWWCSLLAFIPLLSLLYQTRSTRLTFLYCFVVGLITYGLSFHALFWDSLPLSWLGVEGWPSVFLIVFIWSITVLLFASLFAVVITLTKRFVVSQNYLDLVTLPSAYVFAEWLSTWCFSIVNYGPFALLGPNFTMGSPAYQLASDVALLQFSWFGGVYALGFVQAFIGVAVYRLIITKDTFEKKILCIIFAILIIYLIGAHGWFKYGSYKEQGRPIDIALIYTNGPSVLAPTDEYLSTLFSKLSAFIESTATTSVEIIALPEDSRYLSQWHRFNPSIFNTPSQTGVLIIDSASEREDGVLYSRTEYFNSADNSSIYSYKQFLMPLGEEHPYIYQFLLRLIGHSKLVDTLLDIRGFHVKSEVNQAQLTDGTEIVALLCSEGMSPKLYADQARNGAKVFFNLASHAWFHQSQTMHTLSVWNGQVRAVESRRWYARPANDSPAFILDAFGRVTTISNWGTEGVLYGTLFARKDVTPYMLFGQYMLIIPLSVLLYAYIRRNQLK